MFVLQKKSFQQMFGALEPSNIWNSVILVQRPFQLKSGVSLKSMTVFFVFGYNRKSTNLQDEPQEPIPFKD